MSFDTDAGRTRSVPQRDRPGYGCPNCGQAIDLGRVSVRAILTGLPCCGYLMPGKQGVRLLRAARVWRRRRAARA